MIRNVRIYPILSCEYYVGLTEYYAKRRTKILSHFFRSVIVIQRLKTKPTEGANYTIENYTSKFDGTLIEGK